MRLSLRRDGLEPVVDREPVAAVGYRLTGGDVPRRLNQGHTMPPPNAIDLTASLISSPPRPAAGTPGPVEPPPEKLFEKLATLALGGDAEAIESLLNLTSWSGNRKLAEDSVAVLLQLCEEPPAGKDIGGVVSAMALRLVEIPQEASARQANKAGKPASTLFAPQASAQLPSAVLSLALPAARAQYHAGTAKMIGEQLAQQVDSQKLDAVLHGDLANQIRTVADQELWHASAELRNCKVVALPPGEFARLDTPESLAAWFRLPEVVQLAPDAKPIATFVHGGNGDHHWVTLVLSRRGDGKLDALVFDSNIKPRASDGNAQAKGGATGAGLIEALKGLNDQGLSFEEPKLLGGDLQDNGRAGNACGAYALAVVRKLDRLLNPAGPASRQPDDRRAGAAALPLATKIENQLADLATSWQTMEQTRLEDLIAAMRARLLESVSTWPPARDGKGT